MRHLSVIAVACGFFVAAEWSHAEVNGGYFAVVVSEASAAADWYESVLGLDIVSRLYEEGRYEIVNLHREGLFVELLELEAADDRPDGRIHGPFKVGMLVDDLQAFIADLPDFIPTPDILVDARNKLVMVQLQDPDGNIIQIMEMADDALN